MSVETSSMFERVIQDHLALKERNARLDGKMPIERTNLTTQTSILKKMLAYDTGRKQELHKTQFNWRNFRVLFILETPERASNVLDTIANHDQLKQSPLFYVTDKIALDQGLDLFLHPWRTTTKTTTLLA